MAQTDTGFRPCRKFPEYEVSAAGVVRNRKYGNVIRPYVEFADLSRRRKVNIIRGLSPVSAFIDELVYDAWLELRVEKKRAA